MRPQHWKQLGRAVRRRFCAALTLFSYLLASFGVPLPAAARPKDDAGLPFPCQNNPCGCQTAEQCWQQCCCFSPEEHLAWARTHNVEPPAYAPKPAGQSWRSARQRDQEQGQSSPCCSSSSKHENGETNKACCKQKDHGPDGCQTPAESDVQPKPEGPEQTQSQTKKGRWGLGWSALICQALTTLWASTGTVLPPAPPLCWNPWPGLVDRVSYADESAFFLSSNPPDPPPRLPVA